MKNQSSQNKALPNELLSTNKEKSYSNNVFLNN